MTEAATETAPVTQPAHLDDKDFATLTDLHARVIEARARFNSARDDAKAKKATLESSQDTLETFLSRIILRTKGGDLPLFDHQSDAIAKAQADPVVTKLVERLLHYGHDVNSLIVMGYTQDERAAASAYLELLDKNAAERARAMEANEIADQVDVEVPAFLIPQDLTVIEIADLMNRLKDQDWHPTADDVKTWKPTQIAEVRDWLSRVEAIKAEKGDDVTFSDLPEAPAFLAGSEQLGDDDDKDDDVDETASAGESASL